MRFTLSLDGHAYAVSLGEPDALGFVEVSIDGVPLKARHERVGDGASRIHFPGDRVHAVRLRAGVVEVDGHPYRAAVADVDRSAGHGRSARRGGEMRPPMPGRIVAVNVKPGDEVRAGQTLFVLEAMKMQNDLVAPTDARVKELRVKPGDRVEAATVLVVLE